MSEIITIFSTPTCPRCKLLAAAFQKAGIIYEEKPLDAAIMARCMCETDTWIQTAPLVLDGSAWWTSEDLFAPSGKLVHNWLQILKGIKPQKPGFSGIGGQPDQVERSSSKIWGD